MKEIVQSNILNENSKTILLDARGSSFAKGHMPTALNIPYSTLSLDSQTNTMSFKPINELKDIFQAKTAEMVTINSDDNNNDRPTVIITCGTGVSIFSLYLALLE
jgi:thiosulfate/3-mercaptopyruvate sulfurtransferase